MWKKPGCWIALAVLIIPLAIIFASYNGIVSKHENIDASWAQVETVLQRRYDLIPNLVNTVKGYAAHEKGIFEEITRLRSQWGEAKTTGEKVQAASGLESAISRLLLVVERYPDLKANANFASLQDELAGTENRIAVERRRYNDAVRAYNTYIRKLPHNLVAGFCGYERNTAYFEAAEAAQEAPKVEF